MISNISVYVSGSVVLASSRQETAYKINQEFMNKQPTDDHSLKLWLRPSYDVQSDNEEIIALAKSITESLTDDYAKVKAIHDFVCDYVYYDLDAVTERDKYEEECMSKETIILEDGIEVTRLIDLAGHEEELTIYHQSALDVLKSKKGVCEGYANFTCALLRAVGIPAQCYDGAAGSGSVWEGHAWNGAYISSENRWVILDTTWDSGNRYENGQFNSGKKRYISFDPDLYVFSSDHQSDFPRFLSDLYFVYHNVSMPINQTKSFDVQTGDYNGALLNFDSWMSSDPKVATVNQDGDVTTVGYGTTVISYARVDGSGMIDSFTLTVEPQELTCYGWPDTMTVGDTEELSVSYSSLLDYYMNVDDLYEELEEDYEDEYMEYADDYIDFEDSKFYRDKIADLNKNYPKVFDGDTGEMYVKWQSSNPDVIKVDDTGRITAVGPGKATVTASNKEGTSSVSNEIEVFPKLTGVKLSPKTLTLTPKSETDILKVTLLPKNVEEPFLSWSSSDPKVVKVYDFDTYVIVEALKEGKATITVSAEDYVNGEYIVLCSDTCEVTVKAEKKVTSVKLNKNTATLAKGKSLTLEATVSPTDATDKSLTWTSSNPKIASVSKDGKVTAKSKGTATITCKASNGKKASCKVTVK